MNRTKISLLLASSLLCAAQAQADSPLLFQNNSLTYLYGKNFKVEPDVQQTLTFEHASRWTWGDLFLFVDQKVFNGKENSAGDKRSFYGELSPRLSFGNLFNRDLSFGPIKDVLLATTFEFGEDEAEAYLIGPGFALNVPGFNYANLNFYYRKPDGNRVDRNNDGRPDGTGVWQVTPNWSFTIPVGKSDVLVDGYMDWVVDNDASYHANLHFNPQVKYDLGKALSWGEKQLYVGVEYSYWKDKYGIQDSDAFTTTQNTTSLLVKVHF
ncbi:outer membrane protein OmpK [Pseudomonas sp. PS01302]|uniref:outer membrane protein OmpK n=1 Tax=Pseudomonas sp. PS01302 TaxID=2991438 RepID=UPI00249BF1DC|nr:outer membrane protein OmpK [Pseudomonas sp. PS01302]